MEFRQGRSVRGAMGPRALQSPRWKGAMGHRQRNQLNALTIKMTYIIKINNTNINTDIKANCFKTNKIIIRNTKIF